GFSECPHHSERSKREKRRTWCCSTATRSRTFATLEASRPSSRGARSLTSCHLVEHGDARLHRGRRLERLAGGRALARVVVVGGGCAPHRGLAEQLDRVPELVADHGDQLDDIAHAVNKHSQQPKAAA